MRVRTFARLNDAFPIERYILECWPALAVKAVLPHALVVLTAAWSDELMALATALVVRRGALARAFRSFCTPLIGFIGVFEMTFVTTSAQT